ncbi:ABC transporter ATP-binding protein [Lactiplantibacillus plantarum]|uniref:ABC transporter ATP-binding protein n=1 Tax=Lactiplantibacillus plantarum TaxID=1590 RepID=UPI003C204ACE
MKKSVLEVSSLTKSFNEKNILCNINLCAMKGDVVGLVGPNGVGKTTLMKCILGLTNFYKGTIIFNGKEISSKSTGIGGLIENPGLYPFLSGMENIRMFANDVDDDLLKRLIAIFKMEPYIMKRVSTYSLGMKQKIGIIQAISIGKKIVFLDEPLNGLDPQSVVEFRDIVRELSAMGVTFFISSHLIGELERLADKIYILKRGGELEIFNINERDGNNWFEMLTTNNEMFTEKLYEASIFSYSLNTYVVVNLTTEEVTRKVFDIITTQRIEVKKIQQVNSDIEAQILKKMK